MPVNLACIINTIYHSHALLRRRISDDFRTAASCFLSEAVRADSHGAGVVGKRLDGVGRGHARSRSHCRRGVAVGRPHRPRAEAEVRPIRVNRSRRRGRIP